MNRISSSVVQIKAVVKLYGSQTSATIYLPKAWAGKTVIVTLEEALDTLSRDALTGVDNERNTVEIKES